MIRIIAPLIAIANLGQIVTHRQLCGSAYVPFCPSWVTTANKWNGWWLARATRLWIPVILPGHPVTIPSHYRSTPEVRQLAGWCGHRTATERPLGGHLPATRRPGDCQQDGQHPSGVSAFSVLIPSPDWNCMVLRLGSPLIPALPLRKGRGELLAANGVIAGWKWYYLAPGQVSPSCTCSTQPRVRLVRMST